MEEIRCLLWLVMIFGAGNPRIWKALHRYHSPQKAVEILRKPETDADLHLPEHTLRRIRQTGEDKVDEMLERCEKLRLSILWYGDAAYPEQLLSIVNPPVLLFYQGDSSLLQNHLLLTIVGTRNPAEYSLRVEKTICHDLVQMGFVERRGKQLLPTKDGHNLACVLPEVLTSPQLTAQWETELTAIAKGQADPEGFMAGIAEMTRGLIANYSQISEDAQKLFQTERVVIGKCPRCGESVYEGKKNYYCGNRSCQFVMWKNDRFFEERGKAFTPKIAAALLKDGKAKVKGLRSMKTGKTYDGTVLLADTGGKYVNYRVEQRGKNERQQA